ncbi:MAG: hypothetical protein US60_C0008G0046 [Microgenomates group bacterium GW2011_GWC1_37_8]|nr:MAG: hypothetical protein US60_C0008G0046 [Microgenomates group bacterium GW2011_GWC1_37_8]
MQLTVLHYVLKLYVANKLMKTAVFKLVLASFIFTLFFNIFIFKTLPGFSVSLFFVAIHIFLFSIKNKNVTNLRLALIFSAMAIFFAVLFVVRDNTVVQFLNFVAALTVTVLATFLYKIPQRFSFLLTSLISSPFLIGIASVLGLTAFSLKNNKKIEQTPSVNIISFVRGGVVSLLLFIIILSLLRSADPIFSNFTNYISQQITDRLVISSIIFTILITIGLAKVTELRESELSLKNYINPSVYELAAICLTVITTFTAFILIQFRYLFSSFGERELHKIGIASLTYSEYVRKGFFELIVVTFIASVIIAFTLIFIRDYAAFKQKLLKIITGILIFETVLIVFSAAKRLFLYTESHGLTRIRIFGFLLLLWVSSLLVIFFIRTIRELRVKTQFFIYVLLTSIAVFSASFINIDKLIAEKYKPTVNAEVDYFYIANLSADAQSSWKEIVTSQESDINKLESKVQSLTNNVSMLIASYGTPDEYIAWFEGQERDEIEKVKEGKSFNNVSENLKIRRKWQSKNLSESKAYKTIHQDFELYLKLKYLKNRIIEVQNKINVQVVDVPQIDRSSQPPLLD